MKRKCPNCKIEMIEGNFPYGAKYHCSKCGLFQKEKENMNESINLCRGAKDNICPICLCSTKICTCKGVVHGKN